MYYVMTRATPEWAPDVDSVEPLRVNGLFRGDPLPAELREFVVRVHSLAKMPDVWWAGSLLLMSPRAVRVLRDVGETHLEERIICFIDRAGKVDRDSARFIHVLDDICCMDLNRSQYKRDRQDGLIRRIRRLVLDTARIPKDRHLFRLEEFPRLVVSDLLRDRLSAHGTLGVCFRRVEDFTDEF